MEFLKFTGKDNVEIVQADIANYNPERKIHHIRINSALHHLFMKGNSPIEERLLAVRQLFFQKAYSILNQISESVLMGFERLIRYKTDTGQTLVKTTIELGFQMLVRCKTETGQTLVKCQ